MAMIFFDFNDWIDDQVLAGAGPNVVALQRPTPPRSISGSKGSAVIDWASRRLKLKKTDIDWF